MHIISCNRTPWINAQCLKVKVIRSKTFIFNGTSLRDREMELPMVPGIFLNHVSSKIFETST